MAPRIALSMLLFVSAFQQTSAMTASFTGSNIKIEEDDVSLQKGSPSAHPLSAMTAFFTGAHIQVKEDDVSLQKASLSAHPAKKSLMRREAKAMDSTGSGLTEASHSATAGAKASKLKAHQIKSAFANAKNNPPSNAVGPVGNSSNHNDEPSTGSGMCHQRNHHESTVMSHMSRPIADSRGWWTCNGCWSDCCGCSSTWAYCGSPNGEVAEPGSPNSNVVYCVQHHADGSYASGCPSPQPSQCGGGHGHHGGGGGGGSGGGPPTPEDFADMVLEHGDTNHNDSLEKSECDAAFGTPEPCDPAFGDFDTDPQDNALSHAELVKIGEANE